MKQSRFPNDSIWMHKLWQYITTPLCHISKCSGFLVQKLYSVNIDLLGFDNSYILLLLMFDSEKWKVCEKSLWKVLISGKEVMGRITRPLPLPDPWGLPAPYPILPLPDWGLLEPEIQLESLGFLKVFFCEVLRRKMMIMLIWEKRASSFVSVSAGCKPHC